MEVEILHPTLEIVAARSEVRNGPFTAVCNLTQPNMQGLVGMRVARGFTQAARAVVGGVTGCHRVSELLVEVGQAAYQLHFVRFFGALPPEVRNAEDDPPARRRAVLAAVPGMQNTCFSYRDENEALIAQRATPAPPARAGHADAASPLGTRRGVGISCCADPARRQRKVAGGGFEPPTFGL